MTAGGHEADAATRTGTHAAGLAPGTVLAGRFAIEGLLGVGGMGVVYRAHDRALDIPVALKLLRPELASRPEAFQRFRQELLLARQVSSANVVRIHDIAIDAGRWFISMDLVDGESLDHRLDREGRLPVDTALAITRQLALGLQAAHASGIVHRDLKPANVLVDTAGNALISDFGIARSLGSTGLTHTGAVVGTPEYLSPEQARGGTIDGRSDLYALGLMLYEMIAGQPAFATGTPAESLGQRLLQAPPTLDTLRADVPAWVVRLVDRLLQPRPARRLPDAAALIRAIDTRALPRRRPRLASMLALAGAVLLALAALAWWRFATPAAVDPAATAAATTAVPERLAVVIATADDADGTDLLAVAEYLRQAIALQSPLPVVAGERSELALRQAGFADLRTVDDASLLAALPATGVLRIGLRGGPGTAAPAPAPAGAGASADASLWARLALPGEVALDIEETVGGDLAAAAVRLGERLRGPLRMAALPAALLPADGAALATYGEALRLRQAGRMEAAASGFAGLAEAAPEFAGAWLGLAQTAMASGQRPLAAQAAARGAALPGALQAQAAALSARLQGDPATQIAALSARAQAVPDDLDAQLALADVLLEAGEFDAAIAALDALLLRDPQDARAWFLRGKAAILQGDPRAAVEDHLVRALVLFKRGRSLLGEAETTNALGVGYARLGQTGDADEQYRKAVALRRDLGDRRGVASSLRNLAQVAMIQGRFADARRHLDEAGALFAALGDDGGGAAVANEQGLLAEETGDYGAALAAYKLALRGRERGGDRQGAAESLNNIGFAHYQLGDYDNAQVFWRQARTAFAALDDVNGIVRADQNLGLLALARGDWGTARTTLASSLAEAESRHLQEEAAVSQRNLAELDLLQGRFADAAARIARARALFDERGDQRGLVDADLLQAALLAAAGRMAEAGAALQALAPRLGDASVEQQALAALQRAELAAASGELARLRSAGSDARRHAERSGVQVLRLRARLLLPAEAGADDFAAEVATLGHLPLQLIWLEARIGALVPRRTAAAVAAYRQAQALLDRQPEWLRAAALHTAGARALAAAGDDAGAAAATAAADTAAARVHAAAQALPATRAAAADAEAAATEAEPDEADDVRTD